MNSEKLEAIVAELLKPIADDRQNFAVDINGLLEDYLTEAGLRALDADEDVEFVEPNFMMVALLLQQAANIYSKKVDYLYNHVLDINDSFLRNSTDGAAEEPSAGAGPSPAPAAARRRRRASAPPGFERLPLAGPRAGRRAPEPPRPPPTLPRMYCELEPRVLTGADAPLLDYAGEAIGLLADFQVAWRLQDGLLVDELEGGSRSCESGLRPISLLELQAAIQAAAPPPPAELELEPEPEHEHEPENEPEHEHEPEPEHERSPASPLRTSTPLPALEPAPPPAPLVKNRKRRSVVNIDDVINCNVKLVISNVELQEQLNEVRDFCITRQWIAKLVDKRSRHILSERQRLRDQEEQHSAEFAGWSSSEAAAASAELAAGSRPRALELDSDDDGFFEQSSLGESDASRAEDAAEAGGALWQARVLRRALRAEAAGLDVRLLGARVLGALPGAGRPERFSRVLRAAAREPPDVSRLLLATLFLANSGNVEIVQGQPQSLNSFSVRVLSTDERLYSSLAGDQFLR